MRIAFQIIVGFFVLLLGMAAIGVTTAWWAVGTPSHAASTVGSVLGTPEGSKGAADMFMGMVLDGASDADRAQIDAQRQAMVEAISTALVTAGPQVQGLVQTALDAMATGTTAQVDPTPLMNTVMGAMHQVDPQIPAQMDGTMDPITIDGNAENTAAVRTIFTGMGLWWLAWVVVLVFLGLDALIGRRGGMRRWTIPSIFLAVPAIVWLIGSFVAPSSVSGYADNDYQAMLIKAGASSVASKLMVVSIIVLVVAIVLFVLSLIFRGRRGEEVVVVEEVATVSTTPPAPPAASV